MRVSELDRNAAALASGSHPDEDKDALIVDIKEALRLQLQGATPGQRLRNRFGPPTFGQGDIPAILERLAEDVRWEHHPTGNTAQDRDVPYMRPRSGREAVAGFFQDMQEDVEMHSFNPHSFLEGDGLVAAVIEYELTVKATGKRVRDEEIHLWEFGAEGEATAYRHFLDTAKAIEAHS